MTRIPLAVGGAAVVIMLVVVGAVAWGGLGTNTSSVASQPAATPPPTVATHKPTVAPRIQPSPDSLPGVMGGLIAPGRYFVDVDGYRYTFSIDTPGWSRQGALIYRNADSSEFGALWINGELRRRDAWGVFPYQDPCDWDPVIFFSPDHTVDELVATIADLDTWGISGPSDVTVDGHDGRRVRLTVPTDFDFAACEWSYSGQLAGRYQGPGQVEDMRILDLDGTPSLVFTSYRPGTSVRVQAELGRMVDSMEIEPLAE
jgi:hypothetical protein